MFPKAVTLILRECINIVHVILEFVGAGSHHAGPGRCRLVRIRNVRTIEHAREGDSEGEKCK